MPPSPVEKEFTTDIDDLMQSIGPVSAKAMFGGYGIFLDGLMFGLIADNVLYLKVDQETENEFKAMSLEPFTYNKKGKTFKISYYQAPEEALEDGEEAVRPVLISEKLVFEIGNCDNWCLQSLNDAFFERSCRLPAKTGLCVFLILTMNWQPEGQ